MALQPLQVHDFGLSRRALRGQCRLGPKAGSVLLPTSRSVSFP